MRICKNCNVRIAVVETAGQGDIWMHKVATDAPGLAPHTLYLECKLPRPVAEPD